MMDVKKEGRIVSELGKPTKVMSKVEILDNNIENEKNISSIEIYRIVKSIFGFDLDSISVLLNEDDSKSGFQSRKQLIDSYLQQRENKVTAIEIRTIINDIFGINLQAISALEGARISLYSKGQWVLQDEKDLFAVYTGTDDIDVSIYPTNYFVERTGLKELPSDLKDSLRNLGYYYNEKIERYYFTNPTGEAVPDSFKGQTIGAIIHSIKNSFLNI